MQYTIRGIPQGLDRALRARARERAKSLNETVLEVLAEGAGVTGPGRRRRDLRDIVRTWKDESTVLEAIADQDRVDESLWM